MISAIGPNETPKKRHHRNQCPIGKILKDVLNGSFQSYSYMYFLFIQHPKSAIFTSVSLCKGLCNRINDEVIYVWERYVLIVVQKPNGY